VALGDELCQDHALRILTVGQDHARPGGRDGKRGHQHLAPPRDRMLENLDELVDRLLERPVIAVAVRRLKENIVVDCRDRSTA